MQHLLFNTKCFLISDFSFDSLVIYKLLFSNTWSIFILFFIFFIATCSVVREYIFSIFNFLETLFMVHMLRQI